MTETSKTSLLNPLEFSLALAQPRRLTDVTSWHEHIPFALALMDMVRPSVFVELGTHKGDSYCAFCQAVDALGLSTKCYAVDTWEGDLQTGFYGSEVLRELQSYHDSLYGRFSRLIQSTCDDAVRYFPDRNIDLLHIDALHTYEAAKHDFDTWFPKLSDKSIVLFHDTNVREYDFGVWKLWRELQMSYPSFEFVHGHGLGVLGVGKASNSAIARLFSLDEDAARTVRAFFFGLGSRLATEQQLKRFVADQDQRITGLTEHTTNLQNHTGNLERAVADRDQRIAGLTESTTNLQNHTENLERAVADRDQRIVGLGEHTANLERIVAERDQHIVGLGEHTANLERIVAERDQHIADQALRIDQLREETANLEVIVTDLRRFEARVKGTFIYKLYRLLRLHRLLNRSAGT